MKTILFLTASLACAAAAYGKTPRVRVAESGERFVLGDSGETFRPWGFNYDHDRDGRLIEDYWHDEWETVAEDFAEMRALGANVVRVHLQFGRFMESAETPRKRELARLGDLLDLAEATGLRLDLTGLGCYHAADVPPWYDALDEAGRWAAQARFWSAVARRGAGRGAVFCYDLMNEPVVPGGRGRQANWLGPAFGDKHFVQFITRETGDRERAAVAVAWIQTLTQAIRAVDAETPITVGLVPWSLDRPGLTSGFPPERVAPELDFVAMHLYPKSGKQAADLATLQGFAVGKPLIIEETFPLSCTAEELGAFLDAAEPHADGVIGFYWGRTREELTPPQTIGEGLTLAWLELFADRAPEATE